MRRGGGIIDTINVDTIDRNIPKKNDADEIGKTYGSARKMCRNGDAYETGETAVSIYNCATGAPTFKDVGASFATRGEGKFPDRKVLRIDTIDEESISVPHSPGNLKMLSAFSAVVACSAALV